MEKLIVGKHQQYFSSLTQKRTLSLVLNTTSFDLLLELSLYVNKSEVSLVKLK